MLLDTGLIDESILHPLLAVSSIHSLGIALLVTITFLREVLSDHTLDVWVGPMALARHGYRYKVTNGYKLLPDPRWLCTHPSMHVRPARIDQAPSWKSEKIL